MNLPKRKFVVTGEYGSGKSLFIAALKRYVSGRGIRVILDSDRDRLVEQALADVAGHDAIDPEFGGRRGPNCIVYPRDDGISVGVLNGKLLNGVHEAMITDLARAPTDGVVHQVELAVGPDVSLFYGKEADPPLYQSGEWLSKQLASHDFGSELAIIGLDAPYNVREERNDHRNEPVPKDIFEVCATDGFGIGPQMWRLPQCKYLPFLNDTPNDLGYFDRRVRDFCDRELFVPSCGEGAGLNPHELKVRVGW